MEASEIGALLRHPAAGATVRNLVDSFPRIYMEAQLQPITRQALLVSVRVRYQCTVIHQGSFFGLRTQKDSNAPTPCRF